MSASYSYFKIVMAAAPTSIPQAVPNSSMEHPQNDRHVLCLASLFQRQRHATVRIFSKIDFQCTTFPTAFRLCLMPITLDTFLKLRVSAAISHTPPQALYHFITHLPVVSTDITTEFSLSTAPRVSSVEERTEKPLDGGFSARLLCFVRPI